MTDLNPERESEFERIVFEYYQTVEGGQKVEPQQFIDAHPQYRKDLESFFADLKHLDQIRAEQASPRTKGLEETQFQGQRSADLQRPTAITYVGQYRILAELARGGMGIVFKARQEKLRRTVALKMILSGRYASAAEVERFRREAQAAASLKHPGIVGVYEIGVHEGHHYFTMDFIDSESLAKRLQRGPLPPAETAQLVIKLAHAIHYAHQRGVLHRDLKPSNVLLTASGEPYITDFGLAKPFALSENQTVEQITASGQILGTLSYMSPEQAAAKHQLVSVGSDVYSLGAILYECLSGRAPFLAESEIETIRQVIDNDPAPLRILNARIPADLENICMKCLAKEPHLRYGTAEQLAEDLQNFVSGRPVRARPLNRLAKSWRWAKRNPWGAATGALLVLLALLGPVVAYRENSLRTMVEGHAGRAEENARKERRARLEAERANARTKYLLAMTHREAGRGRDAVRTLESIPPTQRTIEWNLAYRELHGASLTFYGHTSTVNHVDISPDEQWIASASNNELRIWNVATGRQYRLLPTDQPITELKFLQDSRRLLTSSGNQLVVWDVVDGTVLRTLEETGTHNQIQCFSLSVDEQTLVVGSGLRGEPGNVSVWDFNSGSRLRRSRTHASGVMRVRLSPDNMLIASVSFQHRFLIHHFDSGEDAYSSGTGGIVDVAFSADGYFMGLLQIDGFCQLLKSHRGSIVRQVSAQGENSSATSLVFSPSTSVFQIGMTDGRIIRVSPDGRSTIKLGHLGAVTDMAYGSDGEWFVSAGADRTVRLWNRHTPGSFTIPVENELVFSKRVIDYTANTNLSWSADGTKLASASLSNLITIWDGESFKELAKIGRHPDLVQDIAFFPDGNQIASICADKRVRVWKLGQQDPRLVLSGHRGFPAGIKVSPDGRWLASGDRNDELRVWDANTGELVHSWQDSSREFDWFVFSPDSRHIASIANDQKIAVRNLDSGEQLRQITPVVFPWCLAMQPDQPMLWIGGGGTGTADSAGFGFEGWDLDSGDLIQRKSLGHADYITSISFLAASNRMLTVDLKKNIQLWDMETWELLREFHDDATRIVMRPSPTDPVLACSFPSLSWTRDFTQPHGQVRITDCSDRFETRGSYLANEGTINEAGFNSEGNLVVARFVAGGLVAWDRKTGQRLMDRQAKQVTLEKTRHGQLLVLPFDDRVRLIDLSYRDQPRTRRIGEWEKAMRVRHKRWLVDDRHRGSTTAWFEMGWLLERGKLSEAERTQVLQWLSQRIAAVRKNFRNRYPKDAEVDVNLLLSQDVRRIIQRNQLEGLPLSEDRAPFPIVDNSPPSVAADVASAVRSLVEEAATLSGHRNFDDARENYIEALEFVKLHAEHPFETLTYANTRQGNAVHRHAVTLVWLLDTLADLASESGQSDILTRVAKETTEIAKQENALERPSDWKALGNLCFKLKQFAEAANAFEKYFVLSGKSTLVPELGRLSEWMPADDFRTLNSLMRSRQLKPASIEGKLVEKLPHYRGRYEKWDGPYYYHWGIDEAAFQRRSAEIGEEGFAMMYSKTFADAAGKALHCAVWELPRPTVEQGRIEGEALRPIASTGGKVCVQDMRRFEAATWSGGKQMLWSGGAEGDAVELGFRVEAAATFEWSGVFTTARDYGTFDIVVDGKMVAEAVDLFRPGDDSTVNTLHQPLGSIRLEPGKHRIKFIAKPKHADALDGNGLGIDYLEFQQVERLRVASPKS